MVGSRRYELNEAAGSWIEPFVVQFNRQAFQLAVLLVRDHALGEDIVQEAFMRAWKSPSAPREAHAFRLWLYRVIVNLARDHHRRQRRWALLRLFPAPASQPADEFDRGVRDQEILHAMRSLRQREREAIYLRFFEDASFSEVARAIGTPEGSARVLVHRALLKLRDRLEGSGFAPEAESL